MNIQEQNRILPGYVWPLCRGEKILSVLVDVPERGVLVVKDAIQVWWIVSYLSSLSQVSMPLKKLGSVEEKIRPVGNGANVAM